MANLIIKPTSGGSLILQDEGGTAANTIDASGNTQLAGTLGVTGNVTMSGTANNLGTATAGNISNLAIVYPAGHIIQAVTTVSNTVLGTTTGESPTNYSALNTAITPRKQSSRMIITFNFGTISNKNGSALGYGAIRYIPTGGSEADVTPIGASTREGSYHHVGVNLVTSSHMGDNGVSVVVSHLPNTTTELTYKFYIWTEASGGQSYINRTNRNGSSDFSTSSSCTIMEVAV